MDMFLDTADVAEIRDLVSLGIVDGVTTNPSLAAKIGKPYHQVLREICSIVDGPVSGEVIAVDFDGMMKEARELVEIAVNLVVKIPITREGLRAVTQCTAEGINTNVTLIFSVNQALLAAKCGASFVSPFIGRLDDLGTTGMDLIEDIAEVFSNYEFDTAILAASIRHPEHVAQAAKLGADAATMPKSVMEQLYKHPLTDIGLERFLADYNKAFGK